jgi:hypothetical protein
VGLDIFFSETSWNMQAIFGFTSCRDINISSIIAHFLVRKNVKRKNDDENIPGPEKNYFQINEQTYQYNNDC